jgi:thiaminase/transcriptional activator TenA
MIFNELRDTVADIMTNIYSLPFNQELANGSLPLAKFIFYLAQDALYLTAFSEALVLTAGKLPHAHQTELFMQFSENAIKAERTLHCNILKKHQIADHLREPSPFCSKYINYLFKMANTAAVEEAVASLLPCFWVYQQVGQNVLAKKIENNPYQSWIDFYLNPEFNTSVDLAITTINELGNTASARTKAKMITAFKYATQLEQHFWQGAYAQEKLETAGVVLVNPK